MANRFSPRRIFIPLVLFAVVIFTILSTNLTATATSFTFTPDADAFVMSNRAANNFGQELYLATDVSPDMVSYLRFDVQNLDGAVVSATLRLYASDSSSIGIDVYEVADTSWGETTVTYNNKPTVGNLINNSGPLTADNWIEIDVSSYITQEGLISLALTTTDSVNRLEFDSREATNPPELIVGTGEGATFTPTPTGTPTTTATATNTPTATATSTPTNTPIPGGGSTFTFNPVADAGVLSDHPDTVYGLLPSLRLDSSPINNSFLRFDVQGLDGTVVTASLRLYTSSSSSVGIDVLQVADNSWAENTITYNNAPTIGTVINSSGAITANSWVEIDVSSYITGQGLVSFAVTTADPTTLITLSSKEGANAPELIVGTGSGATPTATPTASPTPTATPTIPAGGNRNWQQISTTPAPIVTGEYALAYGNGTVVLYGGNATGWPYENSTWEFNGTNWIEATPFSQPNAVYGMSMVYDDNNNVMILFGGSDDTDAALAETWTYDTTTDSWTQLTPTNSPPPRTYAHMVYTGTGTNTEVYLFGGNDGTTYYNDVWRYAGSDWTQVSTSGTPPTARTHHAIAYDPGSDTILLFGGRDATGTPLADTWQLDVGNNDT